MSLEFHTPESGDWLVIKDSQTDKQIYSGHGSGDQIWEILEYFKIPYKQFEHPDEEYEEKYS